jgi:hypothetical protein
MKTFVLIHFFQITFCLYLWAQEEFTTVVDDSTEIFFHDDKADTLTTSMDSMEVEDIHPQDSPEERGFLN